MSDKKPYLVVAKHTGYYAGQIRNEGDKFSVKLSDAQVKNAKVKPEQAKSLPSAERFPSWLKLAEAPKAPAKAPKAPKAPKAKGSEGSDSNSDVDDDASSLV